MTYQRNNKKLKLSKKKCWERKRIYIYIYIYIYYIYK